jgi:CHAT domain-containing protein
MGAQTLELRTRVEPAAGAVLAIRRPSGALTFHPPVETTRDRNGGELTFRVTVSALPSDDAARGVVDIAVKAILVKIKDAAVDKAVSLVLPRLAEAFERAAWDRAGLVEGWLSVTQESLKAGSLVRARPTSVERSLLLLHGTFSNAASAFSSLADSSFFPDIAATYANRVFAFDHFTVSRTPEDNVRMLLEALPDKPFQFDVVAHSRGGLVVRNLVERADVFDRFAQRCRIGRVVLVAAPNEGTPLATPRRWEETVGWIANLLELFPDNPFTTGPAFVAEGLVWLARHLAVDLPGLSAMDGDGPMIRALQSPPGPPGDGYSALVANCNPTGNVLARWVDLGMDQFFGSANDLVVPSEGGWRVDRSGQTFIAASRIGCFGPGGNLAGDGVTHIDIFGQAPTARFLATALAGEQQRLAPVDPAKSLPDRRLLRAGAAGVSAPAPAAGGQAAPAKRARWTGTLDPAPAVPVADASFAITVVNGDLSFERSPLLIGHYTSTRLSGAERFIDQMTDCAMSRSLDADVYPSDAGTHQIFLNTFVNTSRGWLTARPEAVIVVGLGQEGDLRPAQLSMTVRRAVVAWAQRVAEDARSGASGGTAPPTPPMLTVASTLMASGGSGVTAAQSAILIAQGVLEANQLLARSAHAVPRVARLRLIELYTDRASEAWRALRLQTIASPGSYTLDDPIAPGTGPLPRPLDLGYRGAAYDYVQATTRSETGEIEYAIDTRRARTEIRAVSTQARLVRNLVKDASATRIDPQIGGTLYKLLVPPELEGLLEGSTETQLVLDEGTAGIPWELLNDGVGSGENILPWAVRAKLLRKFKTQTFRKHVTDASDLSAMLVIGEPECPPEYPPLPGAYQEATAVAACLERFADRHQIEVARLIADAPSAARPTAREVINTLMANSWRVIHVAGHGALPDGSGGTGGVVLTDGTFLGPREIEAMRVVPSLVFFNCCHLGAFSEASVLSEPVRFASGVARALIDIGVKCVVVAGWAVSDGAAQVFAETFYTSLLIGKRFVDAVGDARKATYDTDDNTWAAYQCYGDPDWRLTSTIDSTVQPGPEPAEFDQIASVAGLRIALETLVVESTYQSQFRPPEPQLARLKLLEQRWIAMRATLGEGIGELFAEAYKAAGDLGAAIRWYDAVIAAPDVATPLRALEQRCNLRVRQAWTLVDAAAVPPADVARKRASQRGVPPTVAAVQRAATTARGVIVRETRRLTGLGDLGQTGEHFSLLGSAMKRLAMIERIAGKPTAERSAVKRMRRHYERALALDRTAAHTAVFYPLLNLIQADLVLGQPVPSALFQEARSNQKQQASHDPDFWSVVAETEINLLEAVANRQVSQKRRLIVKGYHDLARRMHSSVYWRSVYDSAAFVLGATHTGHDTRGTKGRTSRETAKDRAAREEILVELHALASKSSDGSDGLPMLNPGGRSG